ncbi:MAG: nucleotidyltransferase domain-containing protein [Actinomycetota bacterium]|nr:nucleotidyltransferase domain-containing protein [Actinomycetota bacterium]
MARTARVVAFSTTPEMAESIDRLASGLSISRSEVLRSAFKCYAAQQQAAGAQGLPFGTEIAAEPATAYSSGAAPAIRPTAGALPGLAHVLAHRAAIRELCRELMVRRLWLFGSAVRDDFDPQHSDFDFQVEWEPGASMKPWAGELFELQQRLAVLLGRSVDLGQEGIIENPYARAAIEGERLVIHDATG